MKIALTNALLAGLANAGAVYVNEGDLTLIVSALVGTITVTLAVINWIDGRIDKKIKPLQDKLDKLYNHLTAAKKED